MTGAISKALDSLGSAYKATETLLKAGLSAAIQKQIVELQAEILAAQKGALDANSAQTDLLKRVDGLEKKLAEFEKWEAESERYELVKLPPGVYVRSLKKSAMKEGEPEEKLCTACFEERKKGYLHESESNRGRTRLTCGSCGKDVTFGHAERLQVQNRGPRRSW